MNYGELSTKEFNDDDEMTTNQGVYVEDERNESSEISALLDYYEGY
ncbi:MAG: hypothetical protein PHE92_09380 [Candidatus Cloacimonetes bacterium]|jgi:hypothetical protein|nr:hypothetical protein [Candidatus Cloacimonadota bacterium]